MKNMVLLRFISLLLATLVSIDVIFNFKSTKENGNNHIESQLSESAVHERQKEIYVKKVPSKEKKSSEPINENLTISERSNEFLNQKQEIGDQSNVRYHAVSNNSAQSTALSTKTSIETFTIISSAGINGSISPIGSIVISKGASQTFTLTPKVDYVVDSVLVDGVNVGALMNYTFSNVIASHTIGVNFKIKTYIITATADANGSITPVGNVEVNHGSNQSFTVTPATGYKVDKLVIDGWLEVSGGSSVVFGVVNANHKIVASFKLNTANAKSSVLDSSNKSLSISKAKAVNELKQVFAMTPVAGYQVDKILIGNMIAESFNDSPFDAIEIILEIDGNDRGYKSSESASKALVELNRAEEMEGTLKVKYQTSIFTGFDFAEINTNSYELLWTNGDMTKKIIEFPLSEDECGENAESYSVKIVSVEKEVIKGTQNKTVVDDESITNTENKQ